MLGLVLRKAATGIRLLRESPRELLQRLLPRFESYETNSTPVTGERLKPPVAGLTFRKLTDEELLSAARSREEFAPAEVLLEVLGRNYAYGAFLGGTLAAMIWLIAYEWAPAGARLLRLHEGQAEKAQGATLPEHRGKGIMPWALSELSSIAFAMGLRELCGIIASNNVPALLAVQRPVRRQLGTFTVLSARRFLDFGSGSSAVRSNDEATVPCKAAIRGKSAAAAVPASAGFPGTFKHQPEKPREDFGGDSFRRHIRRHERRSDHACVRQDGRRGQPGVLQWESGKCERG